MDLNFTSQATLQLLARNTSPVIQSEIEARIRASRAFSGANGRVFLVDWTGAYLETVASFGLTTAGIGSVTNTAITPTLTVPHDEGGGAPTMTHKPLALDVFAISTPDVTGETRDGEVTIGLNITGPASLATSKLCLSAAAPVAHFHWSADQTGAFLSLTFGGIKQHGIRILALLVGKA